MYTVRNSPFVNFLRHATCAFGRNGIHVSAAPASKLMQLNKFGRIIRVAYGRLGSNCVLCTILYEINSAKRVREREWTLNCSACSSNAFLFRPKPRFQVKQFQCVQMNVRNLTQNGKLKSFAEYGAGQRDEERQREGEQVLHAWKEI